MSQPAAHTHTTAATAAAQHHRGTARHVSLPASPTQAQREELPTGTTAADGAADHGDALRIRVWYLDDVFTRAAPRFVPDVATLRQLLPDNESTFPTSASPTTTTAAAAADHFADIPYRPPAAQASLSPKPQLSPQQLRGVASNSRLDGPSSTWADDQTLPPICLRPSSPTHPGGHPAWISVKAPSREELTTILEQLPVHVLTRRRILGIMFPKAARTAEGECSSTDSSSSSSSDDSDDEDRSGGPVTGADGRRGDDDCERQDARHHSRRKAARDNFLEYFPAHGYAVLCLQAVPLPHGESTRRGATPKEEMLTRGSQTPTTPVIALAFESTLFTFTRDRFGGEGDVRLIVANHVGSPSARAARGGVPAQITAIATLSNTSAATPGAASLQDVVKSTGDASVDGVSLVPTMAAVAFRSTTSEPPPGPGEEKADLADARQTSGSTTLYSPATVPCAAAARDRRPPPLVYPPASPSSGSPPPPGAAASSRDVSSPNWNAATAISVVCSSLISAIIAYMQQSTRTLMMAADQLDELVLQILPSRVDQDDMLLRTKHIRKLIADFHVDALQKERVLKQLLLPAMRQTPLSQSMQAVERYQRALSSVRSTVLKLRKGRDIVNRASMTLISGVSARLLGHCNFMDYLNHVQTQIAVVVMPIAVIPGIFATNVAVPWQDSDSMVPFYVLLTITMGLMIAGVSLPLYKFFTYRTPKALAPSD